METTRRSRSRSRSRSKSPKNSVAIPSTNETAKPSITEDDLKFRKIVSSNNNLTKLGFNEESILFACQSVFPGDSIMRDFNGINEKNKYIFYGMYNHNKPIGFSIVRKRPFSNYEIRYFCSRKGYGKWLMRYIQHTLCSSGCLLYLWSVDEALNFYKKMGFRTSYDANEDNELEYERPGSQYIRYIE